MDTQLILTELDYLKKKQVILEDMLKKSSNMEGAIGDSMNSGGAPLDFHRGGGADRGSGKVNAMMKRLIC